jgi:hypothetical protein
VKYACRHLAKNFPSKITLIQFIKVLSLFNANSVLLHLGQKAVVRGISKQFMKILSLLFVKSVYKPLGLKILSKGKLIQFTNVLSLFNASSVLLLLDHKATLRGISKQFMKILSLLFVKSVEVKAIEPDFKPSCYYILSTKAREINDSIEFLIDYYLT